MRVGWVLACLTFGCVPQNRPAPEPPPEPPPPAPVEPAPVTPEVSEEPESNLLYPLEQAVADALSGPLTHIGSGSWNGIFRIDACAYRNERVIVVNVYCTAKETRAFRVDVFSPKYGLARIYAEAKTPISRLQRDQYYTFKAETEPAPARDVGLPPLRLDMSFAELQAYDKARYDHFLPSCYGGVESFKPQGGCLDALKPRAAEWAERNDAFLRQPPPDWYRLVQELRGRAPADVKAKRGQ
jgi:hypothetical protein